jgi:hypothetical protein
VLPESVKLGRQGIPRSGEAGLGRLQLALGCASECVWTPIDTLSV